MGFGQQPVAPVQDIPELDGAALAEVAFVSHKKVDGSR
jgi:hypothetical protein